MINTRRGLVLGGAALAGASCAQAQPPRPQPGMAPSRGMGPMAGMVMGPAETRYMMSTGMTGAVALRTSDIALSKATDPRIRSFAESEKAEQEGLAMVLMEIAQSSGRPMAPPQPDPSMASVIAALERAPRGAGFDRQYSQAQITGHEALLRYQNEYIAAGGNMHLKHVAMLAKGHITDHLKVLRNEL